MQTEDGGGAQAPDTLGSAAKPNAARLWLPDHNARREHVLEDLVPADHMARQVWQLAQAADLSKLLAAIKSVEHHAGRPAIDPHVLLAVWIYATLEGVGCARRVEDLCARHYVYQWLCGGMEPSYHTLSDFRMRHIEVVESLISRPIAILVHAGLADLHGVAEDGVRVRASAGASSFHRRAKLEECMRQAHDQLCKLRASHDGGLMSKREHAAQDRALSERSERLAESLRQMEELEKLRAQEQAESKDDDKGGDGGGQTCDSKKEPRISSTDADARIMKMPDGGFRPAYNVQLATDEQSGLIVCMKVTNRGSDAGEFGPMLDEITTGYVRPDRVLVDGGCRDLCAIIDAERKGTRVYCPTRKPIAQLSLRRRRQRSPELKAWRERMETAEGKAIYRMRAATAECSNADLRNHGLWLLRVRGVARVHVQLAWYVLAHNLRRLLSLGWFSPVLARLA